MTPQLYCETAGEPPFDWNKWLDKAIAKKVGFGEFRTAKYLAHKWVTCACGNQCKDIARDVRGRPIDENLALLGNIFADLINDWNWEGAKQTLAKIEARSAFLLSEMAATKSQG